MGRCNCRSAAAVTDETGTLLDRREYAPFGSPTVAVGPGTPGLRLGFTGEERDAEIGAMHLGVREYDPAIGRFGAPDVFASAGSQGGNPFTYASNVPTGRTDPSGFFDGSVNGRSTSIGQSIYVFRRPTGSVDANATLWEELLMSHDAWNDDLSASTDPDYYFGNSWIGFVTGPSSDSGGTVSMNTNVVSVAASVGVVAGATTTTTATATAATTTSEVIGDVIIDTTMQVAPKAIPVIAAGAEGSAGVIAGGVSLIVILPLATLYANGLHHGIGEWIQSHIADHCCPVTSQAAPVAGLRVTAAIDPVFPL